MTNRKMTDSSLLFSEALSTSEKVKPELIQEGLTEVNVFEEEELPEVLLEEKEDKKEKPTKKKK